MKKLSKVLVDIVKSLKNNHGCDGNSLGESLQITRAAIWKNIKKLQNYGIKITAIKGAGYTLHEDLTLLDEDKIKKAFSNLQIEIFEEIGSTNEYLKRFIGQNKNYVCLAEYQSKGKGRLNRVWFSPFGKNIYCSILRVFNKDVADLMGLSIVVSLAIVKTLQPYLPEKLMIKWPNDIIYNKAKISGELIEIQAEANGLAYVIIGSGININMRQDTKVKIEQAWTSLSEITGNTYDRNEICINLIKNILDYMQRLEQSSFAEFIKEWKVYDYLYGKKISVKNFDNIVHGTAKGVNNMGSLILELEDGSNKALSSGDTSILK
jgi:BirA family biotin operon repressor/biotin-[acetyl-CoA-carboxylase] ligase